MSTMFGNFLTRRDFVAVAGALAGLAAAGAMLPALPARADDAQGYQVNAAAPYGVSVPYARLKDRHSFGEPVFETGMNYYVLDAATGLTYRFWSNEPFTANEYADMCYAVGGPASVLLEGFSADESASSFAAKVHLADMPAAQGGASIHVGLSNNYAAPTFLQVELASNGVHEGYLGDFCYLQVALDEGSTSGDAVVRTTAWAELRAASAPEDTLVGTIDVADVDAGLTPLEKQVIAAAQRMYDDEIATYGTVEGYVAHVLTRKTSYTKTLGQAKLYGQAYGDICNFSEAFIGVALGVLEGNPEAVASPLADMLVDEAIEQTFLAEVAKDFSGISAEEFIYGEATLGGKMVSINGLREAMQPAENNGGRFANVDDAARFILVYQRNKAGFAALAMGKDYYMDQLNKGPLETLGDILANVAISAGLGGALPDGWLSGYVSGKAVEALENRLDVIVTTIDNPHVTKWHDELVAIEQETRAIFTAPITYTVSRENGIIGDSPEWWASPENPTPEQVEALGLYRDFDQPDSLTPEMAAEYLKVVDGLVNGYGAEYTALDENTGDYRKSGMAGGWLTDLNADGVPELLLVSRPGGFAPPQTERAVHYEYWTWEYGQANKLFWGELESDGWSGGEYLNVWEGADGQYLEMGRNGGGTAERWFMALDGNGVFGRVEALPDDGLVRRIPVAEGDFVRLANSRAMTARLAEVASGNAKDDPTSVFACVKYVGDPRACRMGANRARAYAESIAADFHADVDGADSRFLQAMLVDAGDDGYPLLIKVLANSYYLLYEGTGGSFIADAMLCHYRGGTVKEYPFVEELGIDGKPSMFTVGLVSAVQRHSSVPVLVVDVWGKLLDGGQQAHVTGYYFCDMGQIELFHKMVVVDEGGADAHYWDGAPCYDIGAALYDAALDYDGDPETFFSMRYADQNAEAGTSADLMEAMLRAYADSGVGDEDVVGDPEPGAICYGGTDGQTITARFGASLADLIFKKSTTTYDPHLAYALMALAAAAYDPGHIGDSLRNLGFYDIEKHEYHNDPDDGRYGDDNVAFCVAKSTTRDGKTLVCVPIRGSYGPIEDMTSDWRSDFHLGDAFSVNTWHAGFSIASNKVFGILSHGSDTVDKSAVYVICGHSRGAAVGNLLAVRLERAGVPQQNVFCYNFACPDTARGAQFDWNWLNVHGNIWNIGKPADPVSMIPGVVGDLLRMGVFGITGNGILSLSSSPFSAWGKFGKSYWYARDWSDTGSVVLDLSFEAHEPAGYVELLSAEPPLADMREWGEMIASMPIDALASSVRELAGLIDQWRT